MRILCILQNAWGDRELPVTFEPNPYNKSAKVIRKMVGDNYYEFSNTTDEVTSTPNAKPKPNYLHFEKVIGEIHKFDLVLVCGVQAKETVEKYLDSINAIGVPLLFVPHPAARNLTNVRCEEIRNIVAKYEQSVKMKQSKLEKNYADSLKRLNNRYRSGAISEREYNRLLEWERKNFESGGRLYAERLAKALTPNPRWFRK